MSYRKSAIILDRQDITERLPDTKRQQTFIDDHASFAAVVNQDSLTAEEALAKVLAFRFDLRLEGVFVGTKKGNRSRLDITERNQFSYVVSESFTGYFVNFSTQIAGLEGPTKIEVRIDAKGNTISTQIEGAGSMDSTLDPEEPVIETILIDWNIPRVDDSFTPAIGTITPGYTPEAQAPAEAPAPAPAAGEGSAEPEADPQPETPAGDPEAGGEETP